MAMTPREAFKIGFMLRCADEGLDPGETQHRIKAAAELLEKRAGPLYDAGKLALGAGGSVLSSAFGSVLPALAFGVPVVAGAGVGAGLAKLNDQPIDEEDIRNKELVDEYNRLARQARLHAELNARRKRFVG